MPAIDRWIMSLEKPTIKKRLVSKNGYCKFCHEKGVPIHEYSVQVSVDDWGEPIVQKERACESCGSSIVKEWESPSRDDRLF